MGDDSLTPKERLDRLEKRIPWIPVFSMHLQNDLLLQAAVNVEHIYVYIQTWTNYRDTPLWVCSNTIIRSQFTNYQYS